MSRMQRGVLYGGAAAGMAIALWLIAVSYRIATDAGSGSYQHFGLFWVAMAVGMGIPTAILVRRSSQRLDHIVALGSLGLITTWPKFLRTIDGPRFSDEFGHLFSVEAVARNGWFSFTRNPLLQLAGEYPVLHWIVAALRSAGIDTWTAAQGVTAVAHVATLFLLAGLVTELTKSERAGVVAGALYIIQPGWMFFSAQFAYETLALPLLIAALWSAVRAYAHDGATRTRLLAGTLALGVAAVFTHHLAGIMTAILLIAVAMLTPSGGRRRGDLIVAGVVASVCAAWTATRFDLLLDYYIPALSEPVAAAGTPTSAKRSLFGGADIPVYERIAGLAFPFVALFGAGFAVWRVGLRQILGRHHRTLLVVLGALFFVSLPGLLFATTAEAAHRSWGYSFIGLVGIIAIGLVGGGDIATIRIGDRHVARSAQTGVAVLLVAIALVGGTAAGSNAAARFPGPYAVGNDSRSVSDDARALAEYMLVTYGPYNAVLADRYTGQQLAGLGVQLPLRPSVAFPVWDLIFLAPTADHVDDLRTAARLLVAADTRFVVVDSRMATDRPALGYWYTRTEPGASGSSLVEQMALDKFTCSTYAQPVVTFGPLTLYEIDGRAIALDPLACASSN